MNHLQSQFPTLTFEPFLTVPPVPSELQKRKLTYVGDFVGEYAKHTDPVAVELMTLAEKVVRNAFGYRADQIYDGLTVRGCCWKSKKPTELTVTIQPTTGQPVTVLVSLGRNVGGAVIFQVPEVLASEAFPGLAAVDLYRSAARAINGIPDPKAFLSVTNDGLTVHVA